MRLVRSSSGRYTFGQERLAQLRDLGGRLEHVVARYERLLRDATGPGASSELAAAIEVMNGHLAYVTRRIQELLVEDHLRRHGQPAPVAVCGQAAPPCGELSDEAVIEAVAAGSAAL